MGREKPYTFLGVKMGYKCKNNSVIGLGMHLSKFALQVWDLTHLVPQCYLNRFLIRPSLKVRAQHRLLLLV